MAACYPVLSVRNDRSSDGFVYEVLVLSFVAQRELKECFHNSQFTREYKLLPWKN